MQDTESVRNGLSVWVCYPYLENKWIRITEVISSNDGLNFIIAAMQELRASTDARYNRIQYCVSNKNPDKYSEEEEGPNVIEFIFGDDGSKAENFGEGISFDG